MNRFNRQRAIRAMLILAMVSMVPAASALAQTDQGRVDQGLTPTPLPPPDSAAPDPDDPDLPPPETPRAAMPPAPIPPPPAPMAPVPLEAEPTYPGAASGYGADDRGVTASPQVIEECLCAQRRTASLHELAARAQQEYTDAKARLDSLNGQLAQSRATIDPDDQSALDAYRRLLLDSEETNARVFNDILPRTQQQIRRYNASVERYNARCTGRRFNSVVLAEVQARLACP